MKAKISRSSLLSQNFEVNLRLWVVDLLVKEVCKNKKVKKVVPGPLRPFSTVVSVIFCIKLLYYIFPLGTEQPTFDSVPRPPSAAYKRSLLSPPPSTTL